MLKVKYFYPGSLLLTASRRCRTFQNNKKLASIMVSMPPSAGIKVLRTIMNGEHSPALLTAMMIPATGEIERPIPAINCIGRIMCTALSLNLVAIAGAMPENEKNAATPEPVNTAVTPTSSVITTVMLAKPKPAFCTISSR